MRRRYPIGIQTFSRLRRDGCVYVDKTDLVWELAHYAPYVFLSRPRRFGKSLLSTTLESYFKGEREFFEGLKIMNLEKEWNRYPVIHLDLSVAKAQGTPDALRDRLMLIIKPYREIYGSDPDEKTPGSCLSGIIRRAEEQTGRQAVVIIDEYDAPLLEVMHEDKLLDGLRQVMQELYMPLKANEQHIRFCFITGITKFSQLSIFSTINNLKNVTLNPKFSAICGITAHEVETVFAEDIAEMAETLGCSPEEMLQKITVKYDGYHFASRSEDIFNPFSLLNALDDQELNNYWFSSGTPTFLIRQMQRFGTDITSLEKLEVSSAAFDQPSENMKSALPLLYQSGYLTIKDYDPESGNFTLSIPNQEVRTGYVCGLLPTYIGLDDEDVRQGFALKFWRALKAGNIDLAMREMQAYMAGIPYVEGFKQKLAEASNAEGFYEYTMYLILSMLNIYVRTQVKVAKGRADVTVFMPDAIYIMELKVGDTARNALAQIDEKGYAAPYLTDGRKIVKVGVCFDRTTRTLLDWAVA